MGKYSRKMYLRCPYCDGRLKMDKEYTEEELFGSMFYLPKNPIPTCINCGKRYGVKISPDYFFEIEIVGED